MNIYSGIEMVYQEVKPGQIFQMELLNDYTNFFLKLNEQKCVNLTTNAIATLLNQYIVVSVIPLKLELMPVN